jgi:hypothetical protein
MFTAMLYSFIHISYPETPWRQAGCPVHRADIAAQVVLGAMEVIAERLPTDSGGFQKDP